MLQRYDFIVYLKRNNAHGYIVELQQKDDYPMIIVTIPSNLENDQLLREKYTLDGFYWDFFQNIKDYSEIIFQHKKKAFSQKYKKTIEKDLPFLIPLAQEKSYKFKIENIIELKDQLIDNEVYRSFILNRKFIESMDITLHNYLVFFCRFYDAEITIVYETKNVDVKLSDDVLNSGTDNEIISRTFARLEIQEYRTGYNNPKDQPELKLDAQESYPIVSQDIQQLAINILLTMDPERLLKDYPIFEKYQDDNMKQNFHLYRDDIDTLFYSRSLNNDLRIALIKDENGIKGEFKYPI